MLQPKVFQTAAMAALLASCAPDLGVESASHQAGFSDGCASSSFGLITLRIDQRLYDEDLEYRRGWQSGRNTCSVTRTPVR
jgi:hypothetical protein